MLFGWCVCAVVDVFCFEGVSLPFLVISMLWIVWRTSWHPMWPNWLRVPVFNVEAACYDCTDDFGCFFLRPHWSFVLPLPFICSYARF